MENHGDVFASVFAKIRIGSAIGSHIIYIYGHRHIHRISNLLALMMTSPARLARTKGTTGAGKP